MQVDPRHPGSAALFTRARRVLPFIATLAVCSIVFPRAGGLAGTTTRVSVSSMEAQGNGYSAASAISADGRFVAFESLATNLVSDAGQNGMVHIFVRDRSTGTTGRISVNSAGIQGNDDSAAPAISADGRFVAFSSAADNLVAGDLNHQEDVFVHDRFTGVTTRVSVDSFGFEGNSLSRGAAISADGQFVAFWSYASNLVPGDTNGSGDIFVHDCQTGVTTRVSVDSVGAEVVDTGGYFAAPSISADGRFVAFQSAATNLVADDTNGTADVFVHDRQAHITTRVSVSSEGVEGNASSGEYSRGPVISGDGRIVAFKSAADNLVAADSNGAWDVFVHDRQTGTTTRVSVSSGGGEGNGDSYAAAISGDGRYVAFHSGAANLVDGDSNRAYDVFVHDRQSQVTTRVSVDTGGVQGNHISAFPWISSDGMSIAFHSFADNLVIGDTNRLADVFVHEVAGSLYRATVTIDGNGSGTVVSADGGINCPTDCSERYADGTLVTLTATPSLGSVFLQWGGACTGSGVCTVSMDADTLVTATFSLAAPDLVVSALSNPPIVVAPGDGFAVIETTLNQGAAAAGTSITRYYLSLDAIKSNGDRLLWGSHAVEALAPGAASSGTITVRVPAATPLDTYWLIACADTGKAVVESDETNNCRVATTAVVVTLPDLVTTTVADPPAEGAPGTKLTLGDTVQNAGAAPAALSKTRYYLSADGTKDASDVLLAGTRSVPSLAPGATSAGTALVTMPLAAPEGTYHVLACADDTIAVDESNEANNCASSTGTILIGWPDLVTTAVTSPPAELLAGGSFAVTDTAANTGNVTAGASTTRYYLSFDASKDAGDILLAAMRSVVSLAPGAAATGTKTVKVPLAAVAGTYYLLACADDLLKVGESNEANNCRASVAAVVIHP